MEILLQSVEICDKRSVHHGKKKDVVVGDGKILKIGEGLTSSGMVIPAQGYKLSVGWFDMRSLFGDPGYEHKEDLESGCQTAAAGGFTEVALLPNTKPVVQSKNEIGYLLSGNRNRLTQVHPIGAVTLNAKGEELTEMIDLHKAGAVAFSDGEKSIWHTDILLKCLQYLQKFDGLLMNKPEDKFLNMFGTMNEGITSTMLGLKGMPSLAEEIMVLRDLRLLEYAGGKLHFSNISTANSVALIREAKAKGLKVSCDIAAHQIAFDDSVMVEFDTNYKVNPPFRSQADIDALIEGLKDGTIDVVVSSHNPQDEESKVLEFDLADFGVIGLQTVFPVLNQYKKNLSIEDLIEKITINPRKLLQVEIPEIKEGAAANLTLFDTEASWELDASSNFSKAENSPFWKKALKGKAVGVFNNGKYYLEEGVRSKNEA
jgi:dihydroorotase